MKSAIKSELFRQLPSVDELVRTQAVVALASTHGLPSVTDAARVVLARLRTEISSGLLDEASLRIALNGIGEALERHLQQALGYSLRPVINATGVILHTNLGRAPLGDAAFEYATLLAQKMRAAGKRVYLDFDARSLKSQMRLADRLQAKNVIIVGEEEMKSGELVVRDMATKEQKKVKESDLL